MFLFIIPHLDFIIPNQGEIVFMEHLEKHGLWKTTEEAAEILPDSTVIGAFHNLAAEVLLDPGASVDADVLVTTPARALAQVQGSALKLDGVETVVFTDLTEMLALGEGETLETLLGLLPKLLRQLTERLKRRLRWR